LGYMARMGAKRRVTRCFMEVQAVGGGRRACAGQKPDLAIQQRARRSAPKVAREWKRRVVK